MLPAAVHTASKFPIFILDAAFRSLLLGCFMAVLLVAFRVRAVRAKLLVWRVVLLAAIAMPVLMLLSPAVPLPVPVPSFSQKSTTTAAAALAPEAALNVREYPFTQMRTLSQEPLSSRQESSVQPAPLAVPQTPRPGLALTAADGLISWPMAALYLYLGVALIFFARVLIGMHFGRRLRLGSDAIDDADTLDVLWATARACGLRNPPHLAASELLAVPVTLGSCDPAVLLPASWRDWEEDELAAVLAHEVSHVARRDSLVQMLALVHRAIFWFSPLSWWVERHLRDLAEQASDEAALSTGADRTRYAQALVGFLADLEASPARVWWHGVAMAKAGDGEKRVDRILAWRSSMSCRTNKLIVSALIAISVAAVAISVVAHPAAYSPQDVAAPPVPAPPPPPQQLAPPPDANPASPAAPIAVPIVPSVALPEPPEFAQPAPPVPPQVAVAAPAPPQPPQTPAQQTAPAAPPMLPVPAPVEPPAENWGGYRSEFGPMGNFYWPWGPRFAIVTHGSDQLIMSGSEDDAEHVAELRSKIPGDFIWFEHDGRSYIIRDQATINRAKQIWAQRGDFAKLQQQLQAKQQELSKQMQEQVQQRMHEVRVKIPDMTAELQKLQSEVKGLDANGATVQELGDLQRELGEMQQALGEARWNSNVQEINRRAGELGRQMGEIGRQIGELARQGIAQARQSSEQMRQLFDDAISRGIAKPE